MDSLDLSTACSVLIDFLKYVSNGDYSNLKLLLTDYQHIQITDFDNNTFLHHACLLGSLEGAKLVLEYGAYVNAVNVDSNTALCDAILSGNPDLVELLIQNGARVNLLGNQFPPLHLAIYNGFPAIVKILIHYKADIKRSDYYGLTPLHAAVKSKNIETTQILLSAGADPNRPSRNNTPLHEAAAQKNSLVIHCLCLNGANPWLTDKDGRTPLELIEPDNLAFAALKFYQYHPLNLDQCCRIQIIKSLSTNQDSITNLPLPSFLKDYLRYRIL